MKEIKPKSDVKELSSEISGALEALAKNDIPKAEEIYHKVSKLKSHLETDEAIIFEGQIKRLDKEIKLAKRKLKAAKTRETAAKAAAVTTSVALIALVYFFMEPAITGLYTAPTINVAPSLESMSGFNLEIGKEFTYIVHADDPNRDNLIFTDDTGFFNITKYGMIKFTPTEDMKGIHYIAIIAKDMRGGVDVQVVKFVIGDVAEQINVEAEEIEEIIINETIEDLNESIELMNVTLEINDTIINETKIENISIEINETNIEDLNLTNQTN